MLLSLNIKICEWLIEKQLPENLKVKINLQMSFLTEKQPDYLFPSWWKCINTTFLELRSCIKSVIWKQELSLDQKLNLTFCKFCSFVSMKKEFYFFIGQELLIWLSLVCMTDYIANPMIKGAMRSFFKHSKEKACSCLRRHFRTLVAIITTKGALPLSTWSIAMGRQDSEIKSFLCLSNIQIRFTR